MKKWIKYQGISNKFVAEVGLKEVDLPEELLVGNSHVEVFVDGDKKQIAFNPTETKENNYKITDHSGSLKAITCVKPLEYLGLETYETDSGGKQIHPSERGKYQGYMEDDLIVVDLEQKLDEDNQKKYVEEM